MTEDVHDFAVEHRRRFAAGVADFGIVITSRKRYPRDRRSIGRLIAALDDLLRAHPVEDAPRDRMVWSP